jgi:hypothetical protein
MLEQQYDIFRIPHDRAPLWLEAATTLSNAHARVRQLGANAPGDYLIFDQRTGERIVVAVERSRGSDNDARKTQTGRTSSASDRD